MSSFFGTVVFEKDIREQLIIKENAIFSLVPGNPGNFLMFDAFIRHFYLH